MHRLCTLFCISSGIFMPSSYVYAISMHKSFFICKILWGSPLQDTPPPPLSPYARGRIGDMVAPSALVWSGTGHLPPTSPLPIHHPPTYHLPSYAGRGWREPWYAWAEAVRAVVWTMKRMVNRNRFSALEGESVLVRSSTGQSTCVDVCLHACVRVCDS